MAVYEVVNKKHIRATIREEDAVDGRGNAFTLRQMGQPIVFAPGTHLTDVTPEELTAFPDRFRRLDRLEDVAKVPALVPVPEQARHLNPEVLALVRRAYEGSATHAEQEVIGAVLGFIEAYHGGTSTEEAAADLERTLEEFGLPLWR
jgi:hypothetical protein